MDINERALEARREYMREYHRRYRLTNADKINSSQREWRKKNPGKCREYERRYWEKKALEAEQKAGEK